MGVELYPDEETRSRTILFTTPISEEELSVLEDSFSGLEGFKQIKPEGLKLLIIYEYPLTNFSEIWDCITEFQARVKPFSRLYCQLRAVMEQNTLDHHRYAENWQSYVEDIHIHYFELKHKATDPSHKHLWRRYQKKSR